MNRSILYSGGNVRDWPWNVIWNAENTSTPPDIENTTTTTTTKRNFLHYIYQEVHFSKKKRKKNEEGIALANYLHENFISYNKFAFIAVQFPLWKLNHNSFTPEKKPYTFQSPYKLCVVSVLIVFIGKSLYVLNKCVYMCSREDDFDDEHHHQQYHITVQWIF